MYGTIVKRNIDKYAFIEIRINTKMIDIIMLASLQICELKNIFAS